MPDLTGEKQESDPLAEALEFLFERDTRDPDGTDGTAGGGDAAGANSAAVPDAAAPAGRDGIGRFAPGVSGNPRGRPRGSRSAKTVALEQLLDDGGADVVAQLVKRAKLGRPWAVRLVIERILPRHEKRIELEIPRMTRASEVAEGVATVIECAAAGEITIDEAREFLKLVELQRRAIETTDLAARLDLLEAQDTDARSTMGFGVRRDD